MKKIYKDLRKNLKNSFTKLSGNEYPVVESVEWWIKQHCGECSKDHLSIVVKIMGSYLYPYQKADRKKILKYLKKNKYKQFIML